MCDAQELWAFTVSMHFGVCVRAQDCVNDAFQEAVSAYNYWICTENDVPVCVRKILYVRA